MPLPRRFLRQKTVITLALIFIAAVFLRFLYFPENIYFGYDQARDAFASLEILKGEFKIVGPPTSMPGFNHGVLVYYLFAPIYLISQSDPTGLAIFLRIYSALGIFLIFFIGKNLFNERSSRDAKWTGIICALLFAFSYEQTQYALFMTHPALAVLTVLAFYLGLTLLLFKQRPYGLIIALSGLGLSFQFHFLLIFLLIPLTACLIVFRKRIPKLNFQTIVAAFLALLFSVSTFIIAEIRFDFKAIRNFMDIFSKYPQETGSGYGGGVDGALFAANRYLHDNILAINGMESFLLLMFLAVSLFFLKNRQTRDQIVFLFIWFVSGLLAYFINDTSLYFYGVGTSISLLILVSFLVIKMYEKSKIISVFIIISILISNLYLISKNNPSGPNAEINVQTGMFLEKEKQIIDYMYNKSEKDPFAVNAFTMPFKVNTTWAYLLQWYGKEKYGYLPVWGGVNAPGFGGDLEINNSRSTLPYKRFLIIEPIRGFGSGEITDFMTTESWFTDIIEEKRFGGFIVDYQKPK